MQRLSLILALLTWQGTCWSQSVVVVVRADTSINALSREEVANIFLGRNAFLPNKEKVVPIDAPEQSGIYAQFHELVTLKSPTQLKAYWAKMVFAGASVPPRELEASVAARLVASDGAFIAYVDRKWVTDKMKVVYAF
ncbi:MAG: phosphate ABC transporter substrate-binding protein [Rhodoferax sp.]|nr:phosphate ABC transporter substrate-binding protein [Rhodoferax sp.]